MEYDYDSRADKFWSIYNKEAESYDRALMVTWKDDMDSIIIFAGLFSAVLTAFLVSASTSLKANPTDQTNALLNQTVVLLAQISRQLGPNGSQIITSPPQQLEPFNLNPSDLRVNIFWFMSLGFSLTAALGATLVQQWVRDYLQVFQRFSGSLERSRMRQFLFHGLASNYMYLIVECIPAFIHVSLFLFFIGLVDNLFSTNKAVAISTTAIVGFCALFYATCSVFPVIYAQTPFHTPLSIIFWKIGQIIRPRKHSDRNAGGKIVPVSSDMAKGRLQLAMGHSDNRMTRDTEAICWALTKITGDSEFEPFIASIGGSYATQWGRAVWRSIFMEDRESPEIMETTSSTVQVLKVRIESLLHSCTVSAFSDQQTRFARACICIDAVATLTLRFEAETELDIDNRLMNTFLEYFGDQKRRREKLVQGAPSTSGMHLRQLPGDQVMDTSLEIKWKCLVLIGMKKALRLNPRMAHFMRSYEAILGRAREADHELLKAWNAAQQLYSELREMPEAQLTEVNLNDLVPHWRERIEVMQEALYALNMRVDPSIDKAAIMLNYYLILVTRGALEHMEDIFSACPSSMNLVMSMFEGIDWKHLPPAEWLMPHLVPPRLLICQLLVCTDPRRRPNFDPSTSRIDLVGLGRLLNNPEMQRLFDPRRAGRENPQPYVNQFWRFKDISEHNGAGFIIEMFFATFRSLDDESVSYESKQLIQATFRAIIDNEKSEYFNIAHERFLWALQQELNLAFDLKQIPMMIKVPPRFIVKILRDRFYFYTNNRDQLKEDRIGEGAEKEKEEEDGNGNGNE